MADGASIDMSEIASFAVDLSRHGVEVTALASIAVRRSILEVVAAGQEDAPVDTGATRSSIHASGPNGTELGPTSLDAEAGPTTSYAVFPHDGTSRIPPNPYMDRALDRSTPGFERAMGQIPERLGGR